MDCDCDAGPKQGKERKDRYGYQYAHKHSTRITKRGPLVGEVCGVGWGIDKYGSPSRKVHCKPCSLRDT
jgi:hypothetical protein